MSPAVPTCPWPVRAGVLARSFLIQAVWNYRTLQGTGLAFALLPVLRYVHGSGAPLDRAVERHAGHFNAHPYLASMALGSLARLEVDGAEPETIRRFRNALGGPLGALGDQLVWAGWLPLCTVLGVLLLWAGAAPGVAVASFLLIYNAGHLTLRVWGFHLGWRAGSRLGARLREAGLAAMAGRLQRWLAGAMGVLAGVVVFAPGIRGGASMGWMAAGALGLLLGGTLGTRVWRAAAGLTVVGTGLLLLFTGYLG